MLLSYWTKHFWEWKKKWLEFQCGNWCGCVREVCFVSIRFVPIHSNTSILHIFARKCSVLYRNCGFSSVSHKNHYGTCWQFYRTFCHVTNSSCRTQIFVSNNFIIKFSNKLSQSFKQNIKSTCIAFFRTFLLFMAFIILNCIHSRSCDRLKPGLRLILEARRRRGSGILLAYAVLSWKKRSQELFLTWKST